MFHAESEIILDEKTVNGCDPKMMFGIQLKDGGNVS